MNTENELQFPYLQEVSRGLSLLFVPEKKLINELKDRKVKITKVVGKLTGEEFGHRTGFVKDLK